MYKLLFSLMLLLPLMAAAQTDPVLLDDFEEGAKSITGTFKVTDKLSVMQVNTDNDKFDLIAVDDHMQVKWKTTLQGYALGAGNLKGKIVAVASTEYSGSKGTNSTYKGFLIDPLTGKTLLEKTLYEGSAAYNEVPRLFFHEGGSYFKMVVRQTGVERKLHVGLPGLFSVISDNKLSKQNFITQKLTVIEFSEQLQAANIFSPQLAAGTYLTAACNNNGDLFTAWIDEVNTITLTRYEYGKNKMSGQLSQSIDLRDKPNFGSDPLRVNVFASGSSNNVVYFSLMHESSAKSYQLSVAKLDFSKGTKQLMIEEFTKDHIKQLEKGFVPVNKKLDDVELGSAKNLKIRYIEDHNDKLLIGISATYTTSSSISAGGVWMNEGNYLVNCYNTDLKLNFQQILPSAYAIPNRTLPAGFYTNNNKLYIIANDKKGMLSLNTIFGQLDLVTGKWDKMEYLSKKKISNSDYANGASALWFNDNYILPYIAIKGLSGGKINVSLQQNRL